MKKILYTLLTITCICLSNPIDGMKRLNPSTNDTQSNQTQESFFFPDEVIVPFAAHCTPTEKNILMQVSKFFYWGLKNGKNQIIYANPLTVHSEDREKALFIAVRTEHAYPDGARSDLYDLAKKLLDVSLISSRYGLSCSVRNILNKTPFHYATEKNNKAMQALLIAYGADSTEIAPTIDPLHEAAYQGDLEQVKKVIELGTDPNLVFKPNGYNVNHSSALHIAVHENHPALVTYLLNVDGIDINKHFNHGSLPPLHIAVMNNFTNMTELLLANEAYVNLQDYGHGNTPLHLAVRNENITIANLLIEYGANINLHNEYEDTPLDIAAEYGNSKMVRCLLCASNIHAKSHKALSYIVEQGLSETMKCLLCIDNIPVDPEFVIGHSNKALYRALDKKYHFYKSIQSLPTDEKNKKIIEMVTTLLDAGATDAPNRSSLFFAIDNNHDPEVIQVLLDKEANIDIQNGYSCDTALHCAVEKNASKTVQLLLARGANPDIQNRCGQTALMLAKQYGYQKIVLLITNHNTDQ